MAFIKITGEKNGFAPDSLTIKKEDINNISKFNHMGHYLINIITKNNEKHAVSFNSEESCTKEYDRVSSLLLEG